MDIQELVDEYRQRLGFQDAIFTCIDHEDAIVATVFRITQSERPPRILKVCSRKEDFLREAYFLNRFAGKIPVPKIIHCIEPQRGKAGAILMECIRGEVLKTREVNIPLAREIGTYLAHIHREVASGYGDLTKPARLSTNPRVVFKEKFEEGLEECKGHLPEHLLAICQHHFDKDIDLLLTADGPCVIHRDFRPGNLIVAADHVQGIIDWSSARGGFAEDDFCSLECGEWSPHFNCTRAFLNGYASIRKIPDYKPLMPLLRLNRAIAAIGFTVKRGTWNLKSSSFYQRNRRYLESLV